MILLQLLLQKNVIVRVSLLCVCVFSVTWYKIQFYTHRRERLSARQRSGKVLQLGIYHIADKMFRIAGDVVYLHFFFFFFLRPLGIQLVATLYLHSQYIFEQNKTMIMCQSIGLILVVHVAGILQKRINATTKNKCFHLFEAT